MNHDDYMALRKGTLTARRGIESMITEVGSGVYTYMVMLAAAKRNREADFFGEIRANVFAIRSRVGDCETQAELNQVSNDMMNVYRDLRTAYLYLQTFKPEEACILQSVTNTAYGLIHDIRHFRDKE